MVVLTDPNHPIDYCPSFRELLVMNNFTLRPVIVNLKIIFMKKIIIAFDGSYFSDGAFEFARKLNELQPVLLTGVFLPQVMLTNLWSYADGIGTPYMLPIDPTEPELLQENIDHFEKLCRGNGIDYRVHRDVYDFGLSELKKESIFADLIILGSELFYDKMDSLTSNSYLQETLREVSCSVLLVPEKFDFPKSIILAYDGSEDSIFAIKQFSYLFPELSKRQTVLVYASEDRKQDFPDKILLEEFAARHFKDLTLTKLDLDPKKYFSTWMLEKESAMLVSGSYGRSGISQLFKKSFVKDIIADHRLPVFIAHQ